jgi:type II secretory pathway pseudopilin PulG
MIELVAVTAILGLMLTVTAPFIFKIYKREKLRSAVQEVYAQVLAARMQAAKRNLPVVVFIDLTNRDIITWADLPPYNYIQDAGEPTINKWHIPEFLFFCMEPGGTNDAKAVSFDQYLGNAALVDRIIFLGDGTLLQPQAANSVRPARPGTYTAKVPIGSVNCAAGFQCRGVYLTDRDDSFVFARNVFRISVDDFGSSGKASLTMFLPASLGGNSGEIDYVPGSPWIWIE